MARSYTDADYRQFAKALRSDSPEVRCKALDELAVSDSPKTWPEHLVDVIGEAVLSDPSPSVRQRACGLLGKGGYSPKKLEFLRKAVRSDDVGVQTVAVSSLGGFGDDAAPATQDILAVVDGKNSDKVTWLGVPYYMRPLQYFAVKALADIGPPAKAALPMLVSMLPKKNGALMRIAAALAVIKIRQGDDAARHVLVEELSNRVGDKSAVVLAAEEIRLEAAMAIDSAGPLAKGAFEQVLALYPKEQDKLVRSVLTFALRRFGVRDVRIVDILKAALGEEDEAAILESAVVSMESQGRLAGEALPELSALLLSDGHRDDGTTIVYIQRMAVKTITAVAEPDAAIDVFSRKLEQPDIDEDLLVDIARQLAIYGPTAKKAVPLMKTLLRRYKGTTRKVLSDTLMKIGYDLKKGTGAYIVGGG